MGFHFENYKFILVFFVNYRLRKSEISAVARWLKFEFFHIHNTSTRFSVVGSNNFYKLLGMMRFISMSFAFDSNTRNKNWELIGEEQRAKASFLADMIVVRCKQNYFDLEFFFHLYEDFLRLRKRTNRDAAKLLILPRSRELYFLNLRSACLRFTVFNAFILLNLAKFFFLYHLDKNIGS